MRRGLVSVNSLSSRRRTIAYAQEQWREQPAPQPTTCREERKLEGLQFPESIVIRSRQLHGEHRTGNTDS